MRSQTELEARLERGWQAFRGGEATVGEAFGEHESWEIELEGHRVRLDPLLRRWLWFNGADRWWDDSGVGPGEAVLLPLGGLIGARRLPAVPSRQAAVADWCVVRRGSRILGPVPASELQNVLGSGEPDPATVVWRTTDVRWRSAAEMVDAATSTPTSARPAAATPAPPPARFCVHCGARMVEGARFCVGCGSPRHGSGPG